MGFGSYDEDDQQDQQTNDEDDAEDMTADFKQANHDGEESVDQSVDEMLEHF